MGSINKTTATTANTETRAYTPNTDMFGIKSCGNYSHVRNPTIEIVEIEESLSKKELFELGVKALITKATRYKNISLDINKDYEIVRPGVREVREYTIPASSRYHRDEVIRIENLLWEDSHVVLRAWWPNELHGHRCQEVPMLRLKVVGSGESLRGRWVPISGGFVNERPYADICMRRLTTREIIDMILGSKIPAYIAEDVERISIGEFQSAEWWLSLWTLLEIRHRRLDDAPRWVQRNSAHRLFWISRCGYKYDRCGWWKRPGDHTWRREKNDVWKEDGILWGKKGILPQMR